jgi:hypothetical protein
MIYIRMWLKVWNDIHCRRHFARRQLEVQRALSSNFYLVQVLQLIARCRQEYLYSSCDLVDLEVAREGVEYEDETSLFPRPLVAFRLEKIQAMSLHEKQAITNHLCLLGYKVTQCGDNLGKKQQLECPLLVDFDVNAPPTSTASTHKWKVFKTSGHMDITSLATKQYVKSLRALSVVTNARIFEKFDRLMSIIYSRQACIEYVVSNIYCLWVLELLIHRAPLTRARTSLHVNHYLLASSGIDSAIGFDEINNQHGSNDNILISDEYGESQESSSVFYGDPLFFSRSCTLEQMDATSKSAAIPFLRQFSGSWQVYKSEGREQRSGRSRSPPRDYLFSVVRR